MNEPALNTQALNPAIVNPQALNPQILNPQILNLRDIHLPEPISWWPIAPGWWIIFASILLIIVVIFISRKIYISKQLKRDIKHELENIKQQFQQTQNKSQLAKSLSILLRRASISYYPNADIAGLTGDDWLSYLDDSNTNSSANHRFQSDTGKVLLSAPYLPDDTLSTRGGLDFDAQTLILLCDSWLQSPHKKALTEQALGGHAS
ncbi:MAG: DUF4381 family protein [Gammaproteobacteria bacterium]|nr:DUF4381 family protein [Gammaproteobacteria bacterium]